MITSTDFGQHDIVLCRQSIYYSHYSTHSHNRHKKATKSPTNRIGKRPKGKKNSNCSRIKCTHTHIQARWNERGTRVNRTQCHYRSHGINKHWIVTMRSDNGAGIHQIEIKKNTQKNRTMKMANTSSILNLIETFCARLDTSTFAFRSVRLLLLFMRVFFNAYFIIYSTNHVKWTRRTPRNVCATLNDSLGLGEKKDTRLRPTTWFDVNFFVLLKCRQTV